uniref:Ketoreductase domain-containing protein n=1 Tax=Alexandrium monilatum TaxID=311494 RepID=A0A7S4S1A3_9DINO
MLKIRSSSELEATGGGRSSPEPMAKRKQEETSDGSKVMLVTGASSGVGEALVRHFSSNGWKVAAVARSEEKLKALCTACGSNASAYVCDVSDKEKVAATVARVLAELGTIDVLVNNAAVAHDGKKFWELETSDIDSLIDINLKGTMYVTHAVLKQAMVPSDSGFIIGVASVAGTWGIPNESCYVASKHGMVGFLDTVANETRSTGICVSTICPGGIDTPWWRDDHPYGEKSTHASGSTSHLIQAQELVDVIDLQLKMPRNRVFKRMVMFPKNEWH